MALTVIASGYASGGSWPHKIKIYIGVEQISVDLVNNRGAYRVRAYMENLMSSGPWNTWPGDNYYYLKINPNGAGETTIDSGYQFVDFRKSDIHVIEDTTQTYNHDANGNLTLAIKARQEIDGISAFSYAYLAGTYTAPQIKRASKITAGSANAGAVIPITVTKEPVVSVHDIEVRHGTTLIKTISNAGATPATVTLTAAEWSSVYNLTKTVTSFPLNIKLISKMADGTVLGSENADANITYSATDIPTFTGITITDQDATVNAVIGATNYLQHLSDLLIAIAGAAGVKGSTITGYELIIDGVTYSTVNRVYTPTAAKQYTVTARVKDSRGRWSAQRTLNFTTLAYTPPKITGYNIVRALSNGTLDALGTYSKHTGNLSVASVLIGGVQKNQLLYKIDLVNANDTVTNVLATQTVIGLSAALNKLLGTYAANQSFTFRLTATDKFNQATTFDFSLPDARVPMTWSGYGISAGGIFNESDPAVLQVYGDANIKGGQLLIDGVPFAAPETSKKVTAYNFGSGHLIDTGIVPFTNTFFILQITGHGFSSGVPINSILQGYWFNSSPAFQFIRQLNLGADIGMAVVFIHETRIKIWVPYSLNGYATHAFELFAYSEMEAREINVNHAVKPTTGVTYETTATKATGAGGGGSMAAADILTALKTVDGSGSGLDADTLDGIHASAFSGIHLNRGGDHLNGWEDLPGNLRRCWKTVTFDLAGTAFTATGPTGTYKTTWLSLGTWPAAFTDVPRLTNFTGTVTNGAWAWVGSIKEPTATKPGDFLMYKFANTATDLKVFVEAIGPR